MIDLDARVGPASLRVWGLIANFLTNTLLLYGAVGYLSDGSRLPAALVGGGLTLLFIVALSAPSR